MNAYCIDDYYYHVEEKYYLVDVGYPLMKGYLTPYNGEKYHLPNFRRVGRGNVIEERFNYVHSSLRSAIERTFSLWNNRWRILRQMSSYDIKDQMFIVVATTAFIILLEYMIGRIRDLSGIKVTPII
jgi:hypothetical protein